MEPTSIAKNRIINSELFLLKMPMKHIMPIDILSPPYNPAISEYPISEVTVNPTASKKDGYPRSSALRIGSNIAQIPIDR